MDRVNYLVQLKLILAGRWAMAARESEALGPDILDLLQLAHYSCHLPMMNGLASGYGAAADEQVCQSSGSLSYGLAFVRSRRQPPSVCRLS